MSKGKIKIETKRLADLVPADYNPRAITDESLAGLGASIHSFGMLEPIIWNKRTKRLVGGHQRLKALEAMGETETDVVVVSLSAAKEKAANIALNNPHIQGEFTDALQDILGEIQEGDLDLFGDLRLDYLLTPEEDSSDAAGDGDQTDLGFGIAHQILVTCKDEGDQGELLERLEKEGYECRPLMS